MACYPAAYSRREAKDCKNSKLNAHLAVLDFDIHLSSQKLTFAIKIYYFYIDVVNIKFIELYFKSSVSSCQMLTTTAKTLDVK